MHRTKLLRLTVLSILVLILAACGGQEESAPTAAPAPTQAVAPTEAAEVEAGEEMTSTETVTGAEEITDTGEITGTEAVTDTGEMTGTEEIDATDEVTGTDEPAAGDNELVGVVWQWDHTLMNDGTEFRPDNPENYTVEFLADGQLHVQADCNQGSGSYTIEDSQLTIGPIATTLMACPGESLGSTFAEQLGEAALYLFDGENLVIDLMFDSGGMVFTPVG